MARVARGRNPSPTRTKRSNGCNAPSSNRTAITTGVKKHETYTLTHPHTPTHTTSSRSSLEVLVTAHAQSNHRQVVRELCASRLRGGA